MMQRRRLMAVLLLALFSLGTSQASVVPESEYSRGAQRHALAWLVRDGIGEMRTAGTSEPTSRSSTTSGWRRAGVYGIEFGGAVLGTAVAVVPAAYIYNAAAAPDPSNELLPFLAMGLFAGSLVTSPCLSATGTHFAGQVLGRRGSFWHTLVGSLAGEIVGTSLAYGYESWWTSHHSYSRPAQSIISLSCIVVPTWVGAIVAHNAWR
jgi:hypothetical protein